MKNQRVEFRLSIPHCGSWNRRWLGEGDNYVLVRKLSVADIERLGIPRTWRHPWEDGWCAAVSARVMKPRERCSKSDGFCGYGWMVDRIVRWGDTQCRCEWVPNESYEGEERCIYCRTSRKKKGEAS